MDKIAAGDAKPGQVVTVFGEKYWIQYIWYNGDELHMDLQPHNEPLLPHRVNIVFSITMSRDELIEVE